MCVCSNSVFASVRIPGGVAHIEIGVEVNKWEYSLALKLENSVFEVQHGAPGLTGNIPPLFYKPSPEALRPDARSE